MIALHMKRISRRRWRVHCERCSSLHRPAVFIRNFRLQSSAFFTVNSASEYIWTVAESNVRVVRLETCSTLCMIWKECDPAHEVKPNLIIICRAGREKHVTARYLQTRSVLGIGRCMCTQNRVVLLMFAPEIMQYPLNIFFLQLN